MINYFSKYKFIFYLCNLILLLEYLYPGSLFGCIIFNNCTIQPQLTPDFIISTNHLYAFLIVSTLGFLTYNKSNQFIYISFYLIFLSLLLEVLHRFIPERTFQFSDLFGNLLGVLIMLILFYFLKKNENSKT